MISVDHITYHVLMYRLDVGKSITGKLPPLYVHVPIFLLLGSTRLLHRLDVGKSITGKPPPLQYVHVPIFLLLGGTRLLQSSRYLFLIPFYVLLKRTLRPRLLDSSC